MSARRAQIVILGAAGRDFHDFNISRPSRRSRSAMLAINPGSFAEHSTRSTRWRMNSGASAAPHRARSQAAMRSALVEIDAEDPANVASMVPRDQSGTQCLRPASARILLGSE
jgi:hypothetical protein